MPEKRFDRVRVTPRTETARRGESPRPDSLRADSQRAGNRCLRALLASGMPSGILRSGRGGAFSASHNVEMALERRRGLGQPLPEPTRTKMEMAFGASFEGVTVHTGGEADGLAQQVAAVAFTHGKDLYFSAGAFAPDTPHGQRLLAHELTHVIQQRPGRKVMVGAANDPAELEADALADAVVQRLTFDRARGQNEVQPIQRQVELEEEEPIQALRRQVEPEEEEPIQTLRRQSEDDELAQPLRRSSPVEPVSSAPAVTSQGPTTAGEASTYARAMQAYRAGELRSAQDLFQQVRDDPQVSDRERANATWNVGRIHEELGDEAAALACYREYLSMPGASADRRPVAERIVERMESEQREGAEPAAGMGSTATAAAEPEAATAETSAPHRPRPEAAPDPASRARAVYREGVRAYRAGELRGALDRFQQVLEIDQAPASHRASAIWNIGRIYQGMGNSRAALAMYRAYIAQPAVPPERLEVAQGIIADLERESKAGTAEPEAGVGAGPDDKATAPERLPTVPEQRAQALYGLASQAYQNGDYATALEHLQQLMRTDGLEQRLYTETLYNMAQCYRRLGNNGAAIDMYRGFMEQPDAAPEERERAQQLIATLRR